MARPSKWTPEQWAKARALYEVGKSLRAVDKATGINYKSVEERAKKECWEQGVLSQHLIDKIRVDVIHSQLLPSQQEVVSKEVSKQLAGMEFYATNARKAVKMGLAALSYDQTPMNTKTVLEAMKTGMIVEGLVPFYPNAAVINNAQLNNNDTGVTELLKRAMGTALRPPR